MKFRTACMAAMPLAAFAAASPAPAAQVVQHINGLFENLGDFTPFDINAVPFNTALGTLTDVTVELQGTYTPASDINVQGSPPATVTLTSRLFIFATLGGPTVNTPLGSQTLPVVDVAGQVNTTGAATPVDVTVDLSDLAAFETGFPTSQLLVEYGFRTSNSLVGSGVSDLTTFTGNAVLTYTYNAPEPATGLILGTGLLGLAWKRRRSS